MKIAVPIQESFLIYVCVPVYLCGCQFNLALNAMQDETNSNSKAYLHVELSLRHERLPQNSVPHCCSRSVANYTLNYLSTTTIAMMASLLPTWIPNNTLVFAHKELYLSVSPIQEMCRFRICSYFTRWNQESIGKVVCMHRWRLRP